MSQAEGSGAAASTQRMAPRGGVCRRIPSSQLKGAKMFNSQLALSVSLVICLSVFCAHNRAAQAWLAPISSSVTVSPPEVSPVIENSVSRKSPVNSRQFGELVNDIQIECNSDNIVVTLNTNFGFNGMIYPKGLSKNSSCMVEYHQTSANISYSLPLRSCNTMSADVEDGVEYFNTVMVQPHRRLVTNQGRGYHIRCRYQTKERTITNQEQQLSVNLSQFTPPVVGSPAMPACSMKIYSSQDLTKEVAAENVRIGDELSLVISLDEQDVYGMLVTNCLVRDGMNWGEQPLLDEHGCPVDEEIMPQFVYSRNLTKASVSFQAHKFPYTSSVYYQCNVKLCLRDTGCNHVPPDCTGSGSNGPPASANSSSNAVNSNNYRSNEIAASTGAGQARHRRWVDAGELDATATDPLTKPSIVAPEQPGKELSLEVFSGLHVDEGQLDSEAGSRAPHSEPLVAAASGGEASGSPDDDDVSAAQERPKSARQSERDFCLTLRKFAIIISLASLLLMAAIILMIACMIQRRKREKQQGADSVYGRASNNNYHHQHYGHNDEPYMNRAYARDC